MNKKQISSNKAVANHSEAMETGDHSNGASSKSQMSRGNILIVVCLLFCACSFAQVESVMYAMKTDTIVFHSLVSDVDNITFDEVADGEALIVHTNDGSPVDTTLLSDIQQISFLDETMSIETLNGDKVFALENIAKFLFANVGTTGIGNPSAQRSLDVLVYIAFNGDVMVESPVAIKSLTLFSIDGKMISQQHYNGVETQYVASLQNNAAGVYLLRAETEQGTVTKKVVKPLNK
jgi:hypothetical protein